jgi:hypothetical protein
LQNRFQGQTEIYRAFDTIYRTKLKKILSAYGIPQRIVRDMTMYCNTRAKVVTPDGDIEEFQLLAGVLQGVTLAL